MRKRIDKLKHSVLARARDEADRVFDAVLGPPTEAQSPPDQQVDEPDVFDVGKHDSDVLEWIEELEAWHAKGHTEGCGHSRCAELRVMLRGSLHRVKPKWEKV